MTSFAFVQRPVMKKTWNFLPRLTVVPAWCILRQMMGPFGMSNLTPFRNFDAICNNYKKSSDGTSAYAIH